MGWPAPAQHKHQDLPLTGSQERNLHICHHKAGAHGHRCKGHPLQIQRRARVRQKQTEKPHLKVSTCPAAQHKGPQCNSGQEVAPGSSNALVGVGYQLSVRRNTLPTTQWPQIITIAWSTCCGLGLGQGPSAGRGEGQAHSSAGGLARLETPWTALLSRAVGRGAQFPPAGWSKLLYTAGERAEQRLPGAQALGQESRCVTSAVLCSEQVQGCKGAASLPDGRSDKVTLHKGGGV